MRKHIWIGYTKYREWGNQHPKWVFMAAFQTYREAKRWMGTVDGRKIHRYDKA